MLCLLQWLMTVLTLHHIVVHVSGRYGIHNSRLPDRVIMVFIAIWPVQMSQNAVLLTGHKDSGTKENFTGKMASRRDRFWGTMIPGFFCPAGTYGMYVCIPFIYKHYPSFSLQARCMWSVPYAWWGSTTLRRGKSQLQDTQSMTLLQYVCLSLIRPCHQNCWNSISLSHFVLCLSVHFMPLGWNSETLFFVLSVCLSSCLWKKKLNLGHIILEP